MTKKITLSILIAAFACNFVFAQEPAKAKAPAKAETKKETKKDAKKETKEESTKDSKTETPKKHKKPINAGGTLSKPVGK